MREKAIVLVVVCIVIAVLVAIFFESFVFKTSTQQATTDTTVIDGVLYSAKQTPYGVLMVRFYEFLPDGTLQGASIVCWLLYPNEPTPLNIQAEPTGTIQIAGPPGPGGDVMIDGWLYSQSPTNFVEFTWPPSTIKLWTETFSEPVPANAQG
jgi:hypothetical protein